MLEQDSDSAHIEDVVVAGVHKVDAEISDESNTRHEANSARPERDALLLDVRKARRIRQDSGEALNHGKHAACTGETFTRWSNINCIVAAFLTSLCTCRTMLNLMLHGVDTKMTVYVRTLQTASGTVELASDGHADGCKSQTSLGRACRCRG